MIPVPGPAPGLSEKDLDGGTVNVTVPYAYEKSEKMAQDRFAATELRDGLEAAASSR